MRKGTITIAALALQAVGLGVVPVHAATPSPQAVIQSGSAALQAGAYDAAIGNFTKAIDSKQLSKKTAALTFLNRGLAYQKTGKLVDALADYDYALQLDILTPKLRAVALYNRGLANRKLYRTTLALEDFTNALILDPRLPQAYNSRANVLRELGYYATAIEDYDSAVRFEHPHLHVPLYGKALAHAALRETAPAKTALTRSLLIKPDYRPAQRLLARIEGGKIPADKPTLAAGGMIANAEPARTRRSTTVVAKTNVPTLAPATKSAPAAPKSNRTQVAQADAQRTSIANLAAADVVANPVSAIEKATANVASDNNPPVPAAKPGSTVVAALAPQKELRDPLLNSWETTIAAPSEPAPQKADPAPAPRLDPKSYLIQLSAQKDPEIARDLWARLATKHRDLLGELTPYIIKVETDRKGIIYRIRAGGFESRERGSRLCSQLKRRKVPCFVTLASK